jgi:hypothetical protein
MSLFLKGPMSIALLDGRENQEHVHPMARGLQVVNIGEYHGAVTCDNIRSHRGRGGGDTFTTVVDMLHDHAGGRPGFFADNPIELFVEMPSPWSFNERRRPWPARGTGAYDQRRAVMAFPNHFVRSVQGRSGLESVGRDDWIPRWSSRCAQCEGKITWLPSDIRTTEGTLLRVDATADLLYHVAAALGERPFDCRRATENPGSALLEVLYAHLRECLVPGDELLETMKADFGRTQQYRAYSAPAVIDPVSASTIAEFILTSRKALYDSAADQLLIHGAALMQALPRMIRYLAVYARTAPQEQDGFAEWCATTLDGTQGHMEAIAGTYRLLASYDKDWEMLLQMFRRHTPAVRHVVLYHGNYHAKTVRAFLETTLGMTCRAQSTSERSRLDITHMPPWFRW